MTAESHQFLVEIGTEELPPKSLRSLATAFQQEIESGLGELSIKFESAQWYATPRRLAVLVSGIDARSPDKEDVNWGPPTRVAFDESGNPTKAALAFANRYQVEVGQLREFVASDGKAEKLCFRQTISGQDIENLLGPVVETALDKLPIAKRMRWGSSRQEFVRPIHWICMLVNDQAIEFSFFQNQDQGSALSPFSPPLLSGKLTWGHRFHANQAIEIGHAKDYLDILENQGEVIADYARRQELIEVSTHELAKEHQGHAVIDADLLDEVTALVEWPQPLLGKFDGDFLQVPAEALISSMKEHQKYFHIVDDSGRLLPLFITISNIHSTQPELIIAGNERVIRPRLADAAFFYETDLKSPLADRRAKLDAIVFQAKLGSLGEKVNRVTQLSGTVAELIAAPVDQAKRAAELSKCDLVTEMVLEFDSLQGVMGRYYALNDGEDEAVAQAIEEQYLPRFAGDELPATQPGICLALADRLDTLTGIFGIGEQPSGSRDPFALRRSSLGILRILVEHNLNIDLKQLVSLSIAQHQQLSVDAEKLCNSVHDYILGRFSAWFESDGISPLVFPAVRACEERYATDIHQRVLAVEAFLGLTEASSLAAANKRVSNLLAKADDVPEQMNRELLVEPAETNLADAYDEVAKRVSPLLTNRDYTVSLQEMAALREPLDQFFDQVLVMSDDPSIKGNRLALLRQVRNLFLRVADVSLLAVS